MIVSKSRIQTVKQVTITLILTEDEVCDLKNDLHNTQGPTVQYDFSNTFIGIRETIDNSWNDFCDL
jgi:hypothetical protein